MTCPHLLPDRCLLDPAYVDVDVELFVRHLLGHRRITDDLIDVAWFCLMNDHFHDTRWMHDLLEGQPLPFAEVAYDVVPGEPPQQGLVRWAITPDMLTAVDDWLDGGDANRPIRGYDSTRKSLVLLLWGHGCGVGSHAEWRRSTRRRQALESLIPDMPLAVDTLVGTNVAGLDRHQVLVALRRLHEVGGMGVLGLGTKLVDAQAVGQVLRHAERADAIRAVRPVVLERTSTVARIGSHGIGALRSSLRAARLTRDSALFATVQLGRSVHRKSLGLRRPATDQGAAELASLAQVHRTIGALMLHHPVSIDRSASLYPMTEVPVYKKGNYRAGHPSGLPLRDLDGSIHPRLRSATRTPDGAVWTAWDAPLEPSILIEFEAAPGNLQLESHVETGLWASSKWGKPITLLIVTTPQSHTSVRRGLDWLYIDDIANKYRYDWPGADLTTRLVKAHTLADECPLHGDSAEEYQLRVDRH
ncbi:MAG: hypothetical protein B7C54_10450 [Acidimicrobiales bacterium mtb01]|nr:hypothetical protein [Actinomycetota bacterium]TEX45493.1 MAG: hypothetical protein B7C54_10450 [Acidimicrobiales bacterium mtb01]